MSRRTVDAYFEEGKNWSQMRFQVERRLSLVAWVMVCVLSVAVICLALALAYLAPLKTVVPYVVEVDKLTGHTQIMKQLSESAESYDESIHRHFAARFVQYAESYYPGAVNHYNELTRVYSSPSVYQEYLSRMNNPQFQKLVANAPIDGGITVKIVSMARLNDETIQIRFEKRYKLDSFTGIERAVATLTYAFRNQKMSADYFLLNPLGFVVVSYRVDKEIL